MTKDYIWPEGFGKICFKPEPKTLKSVMCVRLNVADLHVALEKKLKRIFDFTLPSRQTHFIRLLS